MTPLTHPSAQEWIQSGKALDAEDRARLEKHLAACDECRSYALFHTELARSVPQVYPFTRHAERDIRQKAGAAGLALEKKHMANRIFHGTRMVIGIGVSLALLLVLVILLPHLLPERGSGLPGVLQATSKTTTQVSTPLTSTAYIVQKYDTCTIIAQAHNVSVESIILLNHLDADCLVYVGQKLLIPQPTHGTPQSPTATRNPAEATQAGCQNVVYTVQVGDILGGIASLYNVTVADILAYNPMAKDTIAVGQNLIIPLCRETPGGSALLSNEQMLAAATLHSVTVAYCSWQILGYDSQTAYAWVLCEMEVAPYTKVSSPAAIQKGTNGRYVQVSIPRDGAAYLEDIKSLFPADIQPIILGHQIDSQGLEWGIARRKAGEIATAYVIPNFPSNDTCKWVEKYQQDLPAANGAGKEGWKTYTQAEDGFALDVPPNWDVFEIWVGCPGSQDEPHFLYLRPADHSYQLTISFRIPDQPVYLTRTGTPAGDFVDAGTLSFLGVDLAVQRLVYQEPGKAARDMAVFYSGGGGFLAGGMFFTASLDIMQDPKNNQSLPADLEGQARQILESFRSLAPLVPTPTPATTQPTANASLALQAQVGGSVSGVALLGTTAYVGLGPRVAAIDVSQPESPQLENQSEVLPGNVSGVLLVTTDPYDPSPKLVVSAGRYIVTLSRGKDGQFSVTHQSTLPGEIKSMVLDPATGFLYAAGATYQSFDANSGAISTGFVAVVYLNDPVGQQYYGQQVSLPDNVMGLALAKGMLYVGLYNPQGFLGIASIPVTDNVDFGQPVISIPPGDNDTEPYAMAVSGDRLYVGSYMAMAAYDISKPEAPARVWRATQDDNGQVMMMVEGFVLHGPRIDLAGYAPAGGYIPWQSSFTPPELVSGEPYGEVSSMTAGMGHWLLIARDGLEIYDTSDPKALKAAGVFHPNRAYVVDHVTDGHYVYTIDESAQGWDNQYLNILRASDLAVAGVYHFELPDHSALWDWYRGMALDGDRLYVFGRFGTWIFDVSSPIKPVLLSRPAALANAIDGGAALTANGRRLVAALNRVDDSDVLKIYDATDPKGILTLDTSASFNGQQVVCLVWDGSRLYALATTLSGAEPEDWFYVLSFVDDKLSWQSKMQLPRMTTGLAVSGDLVALAGSPGLTLLSVADPAQPQVVLQTPLGGGLADVGFDGSRLVVLVSGETTQVLIFDVSDLSQKGAVPLGAFEVPLAGQVKVLHVSGGVISLSGDASGVEVFK